MDRECFANKTLLIIDDETDLLEVLTECFQNQNASLKIIQATSGNEAIKIIKENKNIDFIVSDMKMSNGNGLDVLRAIKELELNIKTIICTGFSDIKDSEIHKLGAASVFKKPFPFKELIKEFEK